MRQGLFGVFVFSLVAAAATTPQGTVVDELSYSEIKSGVRQFRMYYRTALCLRTGCPSGSIFMAEDGWLGGHSDSGITPDLCSSDETIACWLANHGFVVFSIDYTLVVKTAFGIDLTLSEAESSIRIL